MAAAPAARRRAMALAWDALDRQSSSCSRARNWAAKTKVAVTSGTFPTHGPLFVGLLIGTVVIVAVLTYFPAIALGPITEHFLMHGGKLFSFILLPFGS